MPTAKIFLDYVPAELHEGKDWMVVYWVKHPATKKMKRVRIRCNRIKSILERRKWGKKLAIELNQKLAEGWNPFLESEAPKAFVAIYKAFENYLKHQGGSPDTIRAYTSVIKLLQDWLKKSGKRENMPVALFSKEIAIEYLNHIAKREVSPRTWNNYMLVLRTIWNWFIEYQYCTVNPWNGFRRKKVREKTRLPIPEEVRKQVSDYFQEKNKCIWLACALIFASGLRRTELCKVKLSYINLQEAIIELPEAITKTGSKRVAVVPVWLCQELLKYGVSQFPGNYYLMGRGWRPAVKAVTPKQITDWWTRMRTELNLPVEYQLYSLRDTGVQTMTRSGIPVEVVRDQFGHASISETNKYTVHILPGSKEMIMEKTKGF